MELKFYSNDYVRQLFAITDTFNSLKLGTEQVDRRVIPDHICNAYTALKKNPKAIWLSFIIEDTSNESLLLKSFLHDIPLEHNDESFKRFETKIREGYDKYGIQTELWIKRIFGFNFPKGSFTLNIILDIKEQKGRHGLQIMSDPAIIALQMCSDDRGDNLWSVVVHEFLHVLLELNNFKFNNESLLDYFAPSGIIDKKIGILSELDIDNHQKEQVYNRQWSREESNKLLPLIKNYYTKGMEETIWQFMKEKGFQ